MNPMVQMKQETIVKQFVTKQEESDFDESGDESNGFGCDYQISEINFKK